jgi:hypothetical protein
MKSVLRRPAIVQHVPCTGDSVDELAPEALIDLAAETMHVHVDDVAARLELIVLCSLKQH